MDFWGLGVPALLVPALSETLNQLETLLLITVLVTVHGIGLSQRVHWKMKESPNLT